MDKYEARVIAGVGAAIVALTVGVVGLDIYLKEKSCERIATRISLKYQYSILGGCMVEYAPGNWAQIIMLKKNEIVLP